MNKVVLLLALVAAVECSVFRRNCTIDKSSCKIVKDALDEYERVFNEGKFEVMYKQFAPNAYFSLSLQGQNGTAHQTKSDYAGAYANLPRIYPTLNKLDVFIEQVFKIADRISVIGSFVLYDIAKTHIAKGYYVQIYNPDGKLIRHVVVVNQYDAHNTLRSFVAKGVYATKRTKLPSATNMRKMAWSCELQREAQQFVDKLEECTKWPFPAVAGRNWIWRGYNSVAIEFGAIEPATVSRTHLQEWEKEVSDDGWTLLNSSQKISYGAQMVWWNSDKIGCVYRSCPPTSDIGQHHVTFICLYSPSGNVRGQAAYTSGVPCSDCGYGYKCEATSELCVPV